MKNVLAAILVIAALVFFGYHTIHYGETIRQRDYAALYEWRMNK